MDQQCLSYTVTKFGRKHEYPLPTQCYITFRAKSRLKSNPMNGCKHFTTKIQSKIYQKLHSNELRILTGILI